MTPPRAGRPQAVLLSQAATVPHSTNASGSVSFQSDVPLELLQLEVLLKVVLKTLWQFYTKLSLGELSD